MERSDIPFILSLPEGMKNDPIGLFLFLQETRIRALEYRFHGILESKSPDSNPVVPFVNIFESHRN